MLPVAKRDLGYGSHASFLERTAEQVIRLGTSLLWLYVIGGLEVETSFDVVVGYELSDFDLPHSWQRQVFEIGVVDDDVVVGAYFIPFDDVGVGHLVIAGPTPPLVLDRRQVLGTQLAERDRVGLGGHIEPDRNADHPETDDAFPHRTGHVTSDLTRRLLVCG